MDEILATGATITIRSNSSDGFRFFAHKYLVGIEIHGVRNGLSGNDLEEIFRRGLEWVKDVEFCHGTQWTPEQVARFGVGSKTIKPSDVQALAE